MFGWQRTYRLLVFIVMIAPATAVARQDLEPLTVPADRLSSDCRLNPTGGPFRSNPWKGTDRSLMASVRQMVDGTPPVPDGPPLDARRSAAFMSHLADDVEDAYAAMYLTGDDLPVNVYAVRFKSATLATAASPTGTRQTSAPVKNRVVAGRVVALIAARANSRCFDIVNDHVIAFSQDSASLIGLWKGTSICTDRVAAPACNDEQAVYEFTAGAKPGTVHWLADKMVNGQRVNMGELDLTYDNTEHCWKAEFSSPRVKTVWCLTVDGTHLTGTGRLVPGNTTVRKVDLRKQ